MKEAKNVLFSYIKSRKKGIIIVISSFGIFAAVFSLYDLPLESVGYAAIVAKLTFSFSQGDLSDNAV